MFRIFSKGTQQFNLIKPNVIRKLAYKVKYINGDLIMFLQILELDFFELAGSVVMNMERTNTRKKDTINIVQCSKW